MATFPPVSSRKVAVVGAGMVGATFAYALAHRGLASEIVLVDSDPERAEGEAMDLSHGLPFLPPVRVRAGEWKDLDGSAVVAVTAGASQKPGQTRLDLLQANAKMCRDVVPRIVEAEPHATLVFATNPVDILTSLAAEISGLPWGRVLGSGTTLDSARFRYLLGTHFDVDPRSVHAYVIGEHGDTAVPVWSTASVGGVRLADLPLPEGKRWDAKVRRDIFEQTRTAAYEVIKRKRATYYAIGLALLHVVEAILRDQRTTLTVSIPVRGEYGVEGVALSLPAVVGRGGVREVLPLALDDDERAGFLHSAKTLRDRRAAAEGGEAVRR